MAYGNGGGGGYRQGQQGGQPRLPNEMSGALYNNSRKQQPNHPDFTGKVMIGGQLLYVSAWWKQSRNPNAPPFMSLAFQPPRDQQQAGGYAQQPQNGYGAPQQGYAPQQQGGGYGAPQQQGYPPRQAQQQQFNYSANGPGPGNAGGQWRDQGNNLNDEVPF